LCSCCCHTLLLLLLLLLLLSQEACDAAAVSRDELLAATEQVEVLHSTRTAAQQQLRVCQSQAADAATLHTAHVGNSAARHKL
jgi:hypothetical protein